jgi:5-methylcytosine-specific restriction endonuclease McrA
MRDRAKALARKKRYRERHKEKIRLEKQAYYKKTREAYQKRHKSWCEQNRERRKITISICVAKRRAKMAGTYITMAQVKELLKRHKGKCYWCGKRYGSDYHLDHVHPLSKGGEHSIENLCVACPDCNRRKCAKTPLEFAGRLL